VGGSVSVGGATVVVIGAGYPGKRRAYVRMAELGATLVVVDEPGHWSESLVAEGVAAAWLPAPVDGDPEHDAAAVLDALARAGIRPNGVLTFWEDSVCAAARVAAALGLPGNPPEAVDAARSKVRTRDLSARLGLPTPRARRVRSLDELFAAAVHVGFPAVVKPEFGAGAVGCIRVDDAESLPGVYSVVRSVVDPELDVIFRAGNDLLLEEYLDGVEFDVDLVMQDGTCLFSSVSQNWPTDEPSFQESGLHCPPDHDRKAVRRLVEHVVETVRAFGLRRGVLHVEGKTTSRGPRIVEVNARMGGGRVHQFVEAVWGVDLVEAELRSCLDLPHTFRASRRPQAAAVDAIVYAPATGRLEDLPIAEVERAGCLALDVDVAVSIGSEVLGPEAVFATALAEVTLTAKDLRTARALVAEVLRDPPRVARSAKLDKPHREADL
jgi:biotin carboxylase